MTLQSPTRSLIANVILVLDGVKRNISPYSNVKYVYITNSSASSSTIVNEFDIFGSLVPNAPENLVAQSGNSNITLSWDTVTESTYYNVKRSLVSGGPYSTVAENIPSNSFVDNDVTNGVTYYYVVTAIRSGWEGVKSEEIAAIPTSLNRIILTITMMGGLEREYDLSISEFNAFISWYDTKADGNGPARYVITNPLAKGPFISRNSSLIFDKIITFDYDEYVPLD